MYAFLTGKIPIYLATPFGTISIWYRKTFGKKINNKLSTRYRKQLFLFLELTTLYFSFCKALIDADEKSTASLENKTMIHSSVLLLKNSKINRYSPIFCSTLHHRHFHSAFMNFHLIR